MIEKMKELLKKLFKHDAHKQKWKYVIAILCIGVLLIFISNLLQSNEQQAIDIQESTEVAANEEGQEEGSFIHDVEEMEEHYEKTLENMLNEITGVSEVDIMINIDSTNVQIYEKDLITGTQTTDETDKNGGERQVEDETKETKIVFVRKGDQEVPVLVQTKKPEVRGVFIIAKGAGNATVKKWIVESVSRVLDVPSYKISVMPK